MPSSVATTGVTQQQESLDKACAKAFLFGLRRCCYYFCCYHSTRQLERLGLRKEFFKSRAAPGGMVLVLYRK
eukprot:6181147-Pleurochrysis_carterae.AAC.1